MTMNASIQGAALQTSSFYFVFNSVTYAAIPVAHFMGGDCFTVVHHLK
jgi:hypothetical protein